MGRYNICVYAISKNEEKHVRLWMESMKEADQIVVLDTGSADQTVPLLRELGADVFEEKITPWRFDTARNRSLALVPDDVDICVCVDLDERFEPGWRDKLVAVWQPDTSRARYRYTWSFNPDGSEGCVFWIDKIHARKGFTWEHPVHEVLVYTGNTPYQIIDADGIQLNHYPDPTKSRAQYLPLLELAVQEKPDDDRNMHYLGREYMYRGEWGKCIATLLRHLQMPKAVWRDERCASMRYLAKAYLEMGDPEQARAWYYKSMGEAPYLRAVCKPGSVEDKHLSEPNVAVRLERLRDAAGNRYVLFSCIEWGLQSLSRRRKSGELLPRLSILTLAGGLFLLHCPWSCLHR